MSLYDFGSGSYAEAIDAHFIEMALEIEHVLVYGVFACPCPGPCISCDPRIRRALDIAVTETMTEAFG